MIKASSKIAIISGDKEITFSGMLQRASLFAKHTPQQRGAKTLILSENREGWIYALYSIWKNRGIVVPVDASSTVHDVAYILNDCQPEAIWTSKAKEQLVRDAISEAGVDMKVLIIDDVESADASAEAVAQIEYDLDDTCIICYTSGTTGSPKGVMLSFENMMANVRAVSTEVHIFDEKLRTIILLPLHHVLPLVGTAVIPFVTGGGVAICPSLAAADIMGTLQRGQIGIMIGVPRLWQTLFRGIKGKIDANGVTRALYNLCDKLQCRALSRLVFSSVRKKMGGHITFCVAGGAALDAETGRGLKTLGLDVLEGYGMTEAAPMITFTRPGDIRPGCVGLPVPSVEVKLVDGELCARGKNIMQGYYNRPEETAAIIDSEGWLHTGDLATIDEVGRVTITGRKKEIIVLSNGKNVNPSEIEEKLEQYQAIVKEAAVTQDGDMLRAIIVPQDAWRRGKTDAEMEEIIKRDVLQPYNTTVAPYKKLMSLMVFKGELPRTRLDKLQRFKLKDLLNGDVETKTKTETNAVEYATDSVLGILLNHISREKGVAAKPTDNLETDLGMDSLDKVSLQGFIEQSFGMRITADEILAFPSVEAMAEHIEKSKTRLEVEDIDWHKMLTTDALSAKKKLAGMGKVGFAFIGFCRWFYKKMFQTEVIGMENIPQNVPVILAPNHQSFLDAPLVVSHVSDKTLNDTYFYAKKDHVHGSLMRWLAESNNIIIMDMSTLKDSIRQLGEVLSQGKNLVIFPEGTRTRDGQLGSFKKTFAILSKELDVPVVPVRITGAYEAWPRHKKLPRRHKVSVEYLPALNPLQDETYEQLAERVKQAIAKK